MGGYSSNWATSSSFHPLSEENGMYLHVASGEDEASSVVHILVRFIFTNGSQGQIAKIHKISGS